MLLILLHLNGHIQQKSHESYLDPYTTFNNLYEDNSGSKKSKSNNKKGSRKIKKASSKAQARALSAIDLKKSSIKLNKGGSTVNKAGNYTKPTLRKRIFNRIKAGG